MQQKIVEAALQIVFREGFSITECVEVILDNSVRGRERKSWEYRHGEKEKYGEIAREMESVWVKWRERKKPEGERHKDQIEREK